MYCVCWVVFEMDANNPDLTMCTIFCEKPPDSARPSKHKTYTQYNIDVMVAHLLRCWPNITAALRQCLLFAGYRTKSLLLEKLNTPAQAAELYLKIYLQIASKQT